MPSKCKTDQAGTELWYREDDVLHNEDGPAVIYPAGSGGRKKEEWWLNGAPCGSKKQWVLELRQLKYIELPWGAHVRPEEISYVESFKNSNEVLLHMKGGESILRYAPNPDPEDLNYEPSIAAAKEWADTIKRKLGILKHG